MALRRPPGPVTHWPRGSSASSPRAHAAGKSSTLAIGETGLASAVRGGAGRSRPSTGDDRRSPIEHVSVVIVNWNAGATLRACLAALFASEGGDPPQVILVDNASTDGSLRG